jgi:hypothetical protein
LKVIFGGQLSIYDYFLSYINPGSTIQDEVSVVERRWILFVGVVGMILLSGALISVINNILQNRKDKVDNGKAHYRFSSHVLIIGYNRIAISLIRQIIDKYGKYENGKYRDCEIVLQTAQKVPDIRHELYSNLLSAIEKRITIVAGNRVAGEDLEKLQPEHCLEIFLLGETGEHDHDSLNTRCLELLRDILEPHVGKLQEQFVRCHVLFEYQSTYAVFQRQDIPGINACMDFLPFNFHECWAQKVLADGKFKNRDTEITYPFLDKYNRHNIKKNEDGTKENEEKEEVKYITADSTEHVHFVVLGMSQMGVAMGIQAAHICHFPNFITKGIKTSITFIDENADREMNFLKGRFRHLFDEVDYSFWDTNTGETKDCFDPGHFTDLTFEFIKGRVESDDIQNKLKEWAADADKLLTIAVCFNSSPVAIAAGLYLPDAVYEKGIPVFVRQETSACTLSLLSENSRYKNVQPFGMLDYAYDLEKAEDLAPMAVNYVYDYYSNNVKIPKSIPGRKELETAWKKRKTVKRWSNRYNVNMFGIKERSFALKAGQATDEKTVHLLAEVEHNRWNIEELLLGYRPATQEEKKIIGNSSTKKDYYKDRFVHNDICSLDKIADMDIDEENKIKNPKEYDICLSESLPMIFDYLLETKNSENS